jgi:hypothetical protein
MPTWSERIEPGEEARFEDLARRIRALQEARAKRHPVGRALHYKPVASAVGELRIAPDLPEPLRVGIFAAPGTFPALLRLSNGAGRHGHDAEPDVRGMAVKILGVPGEKLIPPLRDATTQDFLAITNEVTTFRSATEFVSVLEAVAGGIALAPLRLSLAIGPFRAVGLLLALQRELGKVLPHYAACPFFSALPIRWGDLAVKYSFLGTEAADAPPIARADRDHYGPDLAHRLRAGPLVFAMRVQRFTDEAQTPIEDTAVRWNTPWETVAELVIPQQDLDAPLGQARARWIDALSFDPWHAPHEFRPLGELMRARNAAYRESTQARGAAGEPTVADLAQLG